MVTTNAQAPRASLLTREQVEDIAEQAAMRSRGSRRELARGIVARRVSLRFRDGRIELVAARGRDLD